MSVHSSRGGAASSSAEQLGLQATLLVTLIQSIRYHELTCRRPYVLLAGHNVSIPPALQACLTRLAVTVRRIEPVSDRVPSLNKLYALLLFEVRKILIIDSDALVLRPLDHLFSEATGAAMDADLPDGIAMAGHAYDTEQTVCNIPVGQRVNGGLLLLRPNITRFEELLPLMWGEIGCFKRMGSLDLNHSQAAVRLQKMSNRSMSRWRLDDSSLITPLLEQKARRGCFKNEQTAFACYYWKRTRLHPLGCHEFYDHGLFAHGTDSLHHRRCKQTNLDGSGEIGLNFSAGACDAIARHVDRSCAWRVAGKRVAIVHFKGKGKPWKHITKACLGVSEGQYHSNAIAGSSASNSDGSRQKSARAALEANDTLFWDEQAMHGVGACRSKARPKAVVRFANDERVPQPCCKSEYLQRAEWFVMASMAGLQPPAPVW